MNICDGCKKMNRCELYLKNTGIICPEYELASEESAYHPVFESQVGGDHYKKLGVYQPWIVSSKWMTPEELKGAMKHTVFSYLAREKDKGGRSDIKKAHHTIGIYLELTKDEDYQGTPPRHH